MKQKILQFALILILLCSFWVAFADLTTDNQAWVSLQDGNVSNFDVYGATGTQGILNGAYDFDGIDDYVTSSYAINNQDYSYSFWMKSDIISPASKKLGVGGNTDYHGGGFSTDNKAFCYRFDGNDDIVKSTTTLSADTWYMVTCTYDTTSNSLEIYLDGVSENSITSGDLSSTQTFTTIGGNGGSRYFDGSIDEVKFFDKELNSSEVSELYNSGSPVENNVASANEVFYANFDSLYDWSSNTNSATGVNGVTYDATTNSFDFDGTNQQISSPVDILQSDNSPFAFSIWVNPDSTTGTTVVVSDYDNSPAEGILFEIDDGQIQATRGWDSGSGNFEYGSISTGVWTNIVFSYDGTKLEVFKNAVSLGNTTTLITKNNEYPTFLGTYPHTAGFEFDGKMNSFVIYNNSLSNTEVANLYAEGRDYNPYEQTNFTISAIDSSNSASISIFNATIDGVFYNTTVGSIVTPYLLNETSTLNITVEADNYESYNNLTYNLSSGNLQASLDPFTLLDFTLLTPNNSLTNQSAYNITWSEAVSPTSKTVTYNGTIKYTSNSSVTGTFSTTDLFYELDLSSYISENYTIVVNATEADTGASFEHDSTLVVDKLNYLYFYDEQTTNAIPNANVTIDLPNFVTDLDLVTDSQGKVSFNSYYGDTLQTGDYAITFRDFSGYVTPITFDRTYNSLPINKSLNITTTNINISLYYRSNFTLFNNDATLIIEGLGNYTITDGNLFLQNTTISQGTYRLTVNSDGYFNEEKTFTFSAQEELDINLYMLELNNSNSGTVTVRTADEFSRLLADSQVNLLEYDASTLSYIEVSECYTDSNGECKFLIETNSKSYKFTASKEVNGNTVTASTDPQIFEDDISGGEIVLFSEETITLTLSSQTTYTLNPIQNINYDITESFNNVTNQSNIAVSFNSIDGTNLNVCVEYFEITGGIEVSKTGDNFCVSGSSGSVTENAFFTLNMSKEYVAKVYIKTSNGNVYLNMFRYKATGSFYDLIDRNATLPFIVLFIWIFLIGGGVMLKNIPLTGVGIIVGSWVIVSYFPNVLLTSVAVLQTMIGLTLIYVGRKKEDFR